MQRFNMFVPTEVGLNAGRLFTKNELEMCLGRQMSEQQFRVYTNHHPYHSQTDLDDHGNPLQNKR